MKLLFIVLDAGFGGHTRSAVSIAKALRARGHQILFCVGSRSKPALIAEAGFDIEPVDAGFLGGHWCARQRVASLLSAHTFEAAHAFSMDAVDRVIAACAMRRTPFFLTICGGEGPRRMIPLDPIIVFSEELRDRLEQRRGVPAASLNVIPGRIDLPEIEKAAALGSRERHDAFRRKYGISPTARIILRIARADAAYLESIMQGIDVADNLRRRGIEATFVHIGYEEAPWILAAIRERATSVNASHAKVVAVSAQDESRSVLQYVGAADVVIGTGDSAFEAMVLRKPTLVMGQNGFAGIVSPQHIDRLAYCNFSGRNCNPTSRRRSVAVASEQIATILENGDRAAALGEFGRHYVEQHLDVRVAAETYEHTYERHRNQQLPGARELRQLATPMWRLIARRFVNRNIRSMLLDHASGARRRFAGR